MSGAGSSAPIADGTTTQVGTSARWNGWRSVVVDEDADTLLVRIDGEPVERFTGVDLGTDARVAVGDVFSGVLDVPVELAPYDEVAVDPPP